MNTYKIVFITVPDQKTGETIAEALVTEKLAACVNMIPLSASIYMWEGKLERSVEILLVVKTRAEAFEELQKRVLSLHPYQVPEIISLPIEHGHQAYLQWIDTCLQ